jgi:hypothetical protein
MKSLGEDVGELLRGVDSNQAQVTILERFMGEVLPDVDVLGTLSASDDIVAPLNASVVVLILVDRVSMDAEQHSASAVDRAIVSCSLDRQEIGEQLWRNKLPVVERRDKIIAQS